MTESLIPGVVVVATASGLVLYDVAGGPDWSEGDSGRYSLEAVDSENPDDDGLLAEYDTLAEAIAAYPSLAPVAPHWA